MNSTYLYLLMVLFGRSEFCGLDMGFWVSMGVVTLLVVIMNVVFWGMKPKDDTDEKIEKNHQLDF